MYYDEDYLKSSIGKLVIAYRKQPKSDTKHDRRVFIKDIRQSDYDERSGWYNVFSLTDDPDTAPGYGAYRIAALRHDRNDNPMFILHFIRALPDLDIDTVNIQSNIDLCVRMLMKSPQFFGPDRSYITVVTPDYNIQLLCDTINSLESHPTEPVTVDNWLNYYPDVVLSGQLSFDQIADILRTPTVEQLEEERLRKERVAKREAEAQALAEQEKAKQQKIRLNIINFMKQPMEYHAQFPFFVDKWIAYIQKSFGDDYQHFVNDMSLQCIINGYVNTEIFRQFLNRYTDKFWHESTLQNATLPDTLASVEDDILELRFAEMYLAFDEPRKAANKAAKTAAKKAKKTKTMTEH